MLKRIALIGALALAAVASVPSKIANAALNAGSRFIPGIPTGRAPKSEPIPAMQNDGTTVRRRRKAAPRRVPPIDPKVLRMMQLQAGITVGMARRVRRQKARDFASDLTDAARLQGATAGMPRAEIRRREKLIAQVVGGELVRG